MRGADTGPIVVEGDPGASRLIQNVRYEGKIKMPPTGKLSDQEIAALEEWVKMGAPWPNAEASQNAQEGSSPQQPDASPQWSEKQLAHWAFQPVSDTRRSRGDPREMGSNSYRPLHPRQT